MNSEELADALELLADGPPWDTAWLRSLLPELAVRGRLVAQVEKDEDAKSIPKLVALEKARRFAAGRGPKPRKTKVSAVEPDFEVPDSWVWLRLSEAVVKITDGTHHSPPNGPSGEFLYITAKNIKWEGVNLDHVTRVSREVHEEIYSRCDPEFGDVLYIKDGATTGVVTVNQITEPFSLLSSVGLLKTGGIVSGGFLSTAMRSNYYYGQMRGQMAGIAITRVTLKKLNQSTLPFPPLAEQHRIVAKVDELMEHAAVVEERHLAATSARVRLRDAALHALAEAEDHEAVETAWSRIEEHFDDLFTEPEDIQPLRQTILQLAVRGRLVAREEGGEWSSPPFGQAASIDRGGSPRPIKDFITDDSNGLNWIKIGDAEPGSKYITKTRQRIKPEGLPRTRQVYPGDFLLSNSMSFGRPYICMIEGCIHDGWLRIQPGKTLDKEFLYHMLSSSFFAKQCQEAAAGAVVKNLNIDKVRSMKIIVPPLAEQNRIVAKVDELMALCDTLETSLTRAKATREQFAGSISHALAQTQ